jgi:hypothetical protein
MMLLLDRLRRSSGPHTQAVQRERLVHPFLETARRAGTYLAQLPPQPLQGGFGVFVVRHRIGVAQPPVVLGAAVFGAGDMKRPVNYYLPFLVFLLPVEGSSAGRGRGSCRDG